MNTQENPIFVFTERVFSILEQLQFFGTDPQNTSVEWGKAARLNCRVQTTDSTTKIQWFKKIHTQGTYRPNAIVFSGEQYENVEQSQDFQIEEYLNDILSKSLFFPSVTTKESGQYLCAIQNDRTNNYRKVFINIINTREGKKNDRSSNVKSV